MQIRYTSKAKKAIDQASKMSKSLHHHYIGTEHILIGLLKEGTGVAAQVRQTDERVCEYAGLLLCQVVVGQSVTRSQTLGTLMEIGRAHV